MLYTISSIISCSKHVLPPSQNVPPECGGCRACLDALHHILHHLVLQAAVLALRVLPARTAPHLTCGMHLLPVPADMQLPVCVSHKTKGP